MSGLFATVDPRRIKAAHRRRRKCAVGRFVQRYYDPSVGRFLSVDPVTADSVTGGNFNRYWYGNNNPYRFNDPDGRCPPASKAFQCLEAPKFDASRSAGQNIKADAATQRGMDLGRDKVAVGAGTTERIGFTVRSGGDKDSVGNVTKAETAENNAGFTAKATPPAGMTGVTHGHTDQSGLVDQKYVGDAGPVAKYNVPVATVSADGRRVGVHEVENGQLQFRMIRGSMTPTEVDAIRGNLESQQELFYAPKAK